MMIIGNGILANALKQYDKEHILLFASGVSNSQETKSSEFEREVSLLESAIKSNEDKKLIYFSTCSIYDKSKSTSPYVIHKQNIENIIIQKARNFSILRVGNAVGKGGNPNTLINFLKNSIKTDKKILLHKNAGRILVGTDDIARFVDLHLVSANNKLMNFAYPYQYSPTEIVVHLEKYLGKKATYEIVNEGSLYDIEFNALVKDYFKNITPSEYLDRIFNAYL